MAQAPYMPVFTDALIGDTLKLSAEEFGCYCLLLFATWRNNGQALDDDDDELARICRIPRWKWKKFLRAKLVVFFKISDGKWHQKRLEKEWAYVQEQAAISRKNGRNGGRPKKSEPRRSPSKKNPAGFDEKNPAGFSGFKTPSKNSMKSMGEKNPENLPIPIPIEVRGSTPPYTPPADDEVRRHDRRGSRLEADWQPSTADREFAGRLGLDADEVAAAFRDYWTSIAGARGRRADWHATWRNRCRDVARRAAGDESRSGSNRQSYSRIAAALDRIVLAPPVAQSD